MGQLHKQSSGLSAHDVPCLNQCSADLCLGEIALARRDPIFPLWKDTIDDLNRPRGPLALHRLLHTISDHDLNEAMQRERFGISMAQQEGRATQFSHRRIELEWIPHAVL